MKGIVREYGVVLIAALAAAFVMKAFVVDAVVIPSRSMERTLLEGDYVLMSKMISHDGAPPSGLPSGDPSVADVSPIKKVLSPAIQRGDVVVFDLPPGCGIDESGLFVKRCVARGGDEVSFRGARVCVPYKGLIVHLNSANLPVWEPVIQGEGHAIATGAAGGIEIDGIRTDTYTVRKDYLFVAGDNRDHSYDSRSWGFLPAENVVGRVLMVYWSMDGSHVRWDRIGSLVH